MAGIAGIYDKRKSILLKHCIGIMLLRLRHRGAQYTKTFCYRRLILGQVDTATIYKKNRRVSYVHKGHHLAVVCDSKILNYEILKKKLQKKGYVFISEDDAELIAALYVEYKQKSARHIDGIFAYVVYDKKNKKIFGVRDHFGQKPLVYHVSKKLFLFASEAKSILSQLSKKTIDNQAVYHYLSLGFMPSPYTGFKEIKKLAAGSYFIFDIATHRLTVHKYFNLPINTKKRCRRSTWISKISISLHTAIKKHTKEEIVGMILLPITCPRISNFISAHGINIQKISLGDSTNVHHPSQYFLKQKNKKDWIKIIEHLDEPFADPSILSISLLAKKAKKSVSTIINTHASTELFVRSKKHRDIFYSNLFPNFNKLLVFFFKKNISMSLLLATVSQKSIPRQYYDYTNFFDSETKRVILDKNLYKYSWSTIFVTNIESKISNIKDHRDQLFYMDMHLNIPDNVNTLYEKVYRRSGLEMKTPLLDLNFVKLVTKMKRYHNISLFGRKNIFNIMFDRYSNGTQLPSTIDLFDTWIREQKLNYKILSELGIHVPTTLSSHQFYLLKILEIWYKKHFAYEN